MRSVVDNINNGQIYRNFGTLTFSVSMVEHNIRPGAVCEGSFSVTATTNHLTEGYIYSDDYRMECITTEFSGAYDEVAYRFHGENTIPGQEIRGSFTLVTNRGEYQIPFIIRVEADVFESSLGPVRNIFHFANLAKVKWEEALELFYDPGFVKLFTGPDKEFLSVYKCLSGVPGSERNMDEFLVSIRKKTPIEYIPAEKSVEISDPAGPSRYSMDITRNGWGYARFRVETEGDFLSIQDSEVTQESFLGNKYQLYYFIDPSMLHTGNNFGSIMLKTDSDTVVIPVVVKITGEKTHFKDMLKFRMQRVISLMEFYESHRLKKISTKTWLQESTSIIEDMLANDPEDLRARLYRIHLMITQERANEAMWNLRKVKDQALGVRNEHTDLWCYYLYLNSLIDESEMDMDTLIEEVEFCYKTDPSNWRLCWLLSVMSDEYSNALRRWEMYKTAFERGCNSPAIYLEAARIALDNPTIISGLEGFDLQVIRYICKKGILNDDIAIVIKTIAERIKDYSPQLVRLLIFCYQDNPHDELLTIICSQLIKGGIRTREAHKWYGYAVNQELKITRLYEYYMLSMDKSVPAPIPRIVLMYFSFQSDLDFETNAYLYAYVVENRREDAEMYSKYRRQIEEYMADQIEAGRNNRYLAVLYKNLIDDNMLTDPEFARKVADIVFTHEVDVSAYPDARFCILCYDHHDREERYPVTNGKAEIPIFSEDYCIAIEDGYRNRFVASKPVTCERLIPPGRILLTLQLMVRDHTGIDVHCCMEKNISTDIRPENEFRFKSLINKGYFSKEYARVITMRLIRFYYDQDRIEELDPFLESVSCDNIAEVERTECVKLLIKRGMYDKSLEWMYTFGPEGIDKVAISDLIYGWLPIHRDDPGEYTKFVVQLITQCLESGKINLLCIQFVVAHISGSVRTMRDIWKKAMEVDADRSVLNEKILIQIMFSGAYIPERAEILKDYAYKEPDENVLLAALRMAAHENFVEGGVTSDTTYDVMTDAYETGMTPGLVCDLAYVRHFAENKNLIDERTRPLLKDALHRLLAKDVVISCFKELADFMPSMTQFADAVIIEYRTVPGAKVDIHYIIESSEDDYHTDPMDEVYKGVYSKMFTIFFGEKIMYYITEESEGSSDKLSESNTIVRNDMGDSQVKGRFGLIDDMCIGRALKDYNTVDGLMEDYYRQEYISSRLFAIHR